MTEKEKMLLGMYYKASDKDLTEARNTARSLAAEYNSTAPTELERREDILKKLFKKCGKNVYIEPPFYCDYGSNIALGDNVYINFDCIILDVCNVHHRKQRIYCTKGIHICRRPPH